MYSGDREGIHIYYFVVRLFVPSVSTVRILWLLPLWVHDDIYYVLTSGRQSITIRKRLGLFFVCLAGKHGHLFMSTHYHHLFAVVAEFHLLSMDRTAIHVLFFIMYA